MVEEVTGVEAEAEVEVEVEAEEVEEGIAAVAGETVGDAESRAVATATLFTAAPPLLGLVVESDPPPRGMFLNLTPMLLGGGAGGLVCWSLVTGL